jgi:hypothetical protein
VFLLAVPLDAGWRTGVALLAIAFYMVIGSVVDVRAYLDSLVGAASLPSAAVRIAVGVVAIVAAVRLPQPVAAEGQPSSIAAPSRSSRASATTRSARADR